MSGNLLEHVPCWGELELCTAPVDLDQGPDLNKAGYFIDSNVLRVKLWFINLRKNWKVLNFLEHHRAAKDEGHDLSIDSSVRSFHWISHRWRLGDRRHLSQMKDEENVFFSSSSCSSWSLLEAWSNVSVQSAVVCYPKPMVVCSEAPETGSVCQCSSVTNC